MATLHDIELKHHFKYRGKLHLLPLLDVSLYESVKDNDYLVVCLEDGTVYIMDGETEVEAV